jgi:WD40 repeat protein
MIPRKSVDLPQNFSCTRQDIPAAAGSECRFVAILAHGRVLASGCEDGRIRLWNLPSTWQAAPADCRQKNGEQAGKGGKLMLAGEAR